MPIDKRWGPFIEQLEALEFDPDEWIDVFKALVESKVNPGDIENPKQAAKKLSSLMVLELTRLATTARSEQVRRHAATELAHMGGARPPKQKDDDFSDMTEEELDARIGSYIEDEASKKTKHRAKKRARTTDRHEGEDVLTAADQELQIPEGCPDPIP